MVDGGGEVSRAGGALDVGLGHRAVVLLEAHLYPLLQLKCRSELGFHFNSGEKSLSVSQKYVFNLVENRISIFIFSC